MGQPRPPKPSGSGVGRLLLIALGAAVAVVAVLAIMTRGGGGPDTTPPETAISKQLKAAGYHKVRDEKRHSDGVGRDAVTEWWERSQAPEQVVVTDNSSYTEKGKLVVSAVVYNSSGGKGKLTCQPDAEHIRADLSEIITDADAVYRGVNDGASRRTPVHQTVCHSMEISWDVPRPDGISVHPRPNGGAGGGRRANRKITL